MSASDAFASAGRSPRPFARAAGPTPGPAATWRIGVLAAAATLVLAPGQAKGQDDGLAALLRQCRAVAETSARTACYDRIPLEEAVPSPAPNVRARAGAGFGSNQLPPAAATPAAEPERISARVMRALERQPGLHLLTLEDGSEWLFVDSAPAAYDPPRPGSTVEISRASMGSYLIRFAGQRAIRARRVR